MEIRRLPALYLNAMIGTARLPLTVGQRLRNASEAAAWPPALAFDDLGGNLRASIGHLVHDDDLVRRGRLDQARVSELRESARLAREAERTRIAADNELDAHRRQADRDREAARQKADQAEVASERATSEKELAVEAKATAAKERADQRSRATRATLTKTERAARKQAIADEKVAIEAAKQAEGAKRSVQATDKKLRSTRAARRRSA